MQRLTGVIAQKFDWLPNKIPITLHRRTIELDLFQYLLRHTFWRPRDILFLAGRVISAAEYYRSKELNFDAGTVKLIVSRSLDAIINLEFIREFNGTIENIEFIIRRFEGANQVMSFPEFFKCLQGVKVVRALPSDATRDKDGLSDQERALNLLYNIGLLAFISTENLWQRGALRPRGYLFLMKVTQFSRCSRLLTEKKCS